MASWTPTQWSQGKCIGTGAFGKVYRCCDSNSSMLFALKKVKFGEGREKNSKEIQALKNEIEILSKIQHERIVQYYGCQEDHSSLSIFLELMPAKSLRDHMKDFGPLSETVASFTTEQILQGLFFLHSINIAHRDIKAANILRDTLGNIKLTDFGVSKHVENITDSAGLKTEIGSPYWMAPEVFRGNGYGQNADLWSVGCTVVEMLTTKPPYCDYEPGQAIFKIHEGEHPEYVLPSGSSNHVQSFLKITFQKISSERTSAESLLQHNFITAYGKAKDQYNTAQQLCKEKGKAIDEMKAKDEALKAKDNQIKAKDDEIKAKNDEIKAKDDEIKAKDKAIKAKDNQIKAKDDEIKALANEVLQLKNKEEELKIENVQQRDLMTRLTMGNINLLMIGKTGNGKSALGNTILRRKAFKSMDGLSSVTTKVQYEVSEFNDLVIKVVDGPGVGYLNLDFEEANKLVIDAMSNAISVNPEGYHAFLLVVKFGPRFTADDQDTIAFLKKIFGENFVRDFCILVMTYGDHFQREEIGLSFRDWCRKQVGYSQQLIMECNKRVLLFDNITMDEEKIARQINDLIQMVDHLTYLGHRYKAVNFDNAKTTRERLMIEAKKPMICEETLTETSLIIQKLHIIQASNEPEKCKSDLDKLLTHTEALYDHIKTQDNGTGALHDLVETVDTVKKTIEDEIRLVTCVAKEKENMTRLETEMQRAFEEKLSSK